MADKTLDPTGKILGEPGAKMDAGKPDLVTALDVPDGSARYKKALVRHIVGPDFDEESGLRSLAHAAWNALAVLEFEINKRK